MKKLVIVFVLIFLVGMISANSCSIKTANQCSSAGEYAVMGLSASSNAHGESPIKSCRQFDDTGLGVCNALPHNGCTWVLGLGWCLGTYVDLEYNNVLCCDFGDGVQTDECTGSNKILGLSSASNAHAEIPTLDNYYVDVCYEDLSCVSVNGNQNCPTGTSSILSLSADTNAHLGGASSYTSLKNKKICCNVETTFDCTQFTTKTTCLAENTATEIKCTWAPPKETTYPNGGCCGVGEFYDLDLDLCVGSSYGVCYKNWQDTPEGQKSSPSDQATVRAYQASSNWNFYCDTSVSGQDNYGFWYEVKIVA